MYSVESDPAAQKQVAALPGEAIAKYAEVVATLGVAPWSGDAYDRLRPDANLRTLPFGPGSEGLVIYMVLEDQRRVAVLRVIWTG
ncbi:hypothetical protein BKA15_001314 [Microlunatus parietis]|uniref:Uncharacterized protein n=1 Tax=Microlunatus parietis TaxID=682979 RepID=A0A7Y9I4Q8_9ACTN|nr:hypothetical protein [Microlunatus parietis]